MNKDMIRQNLVMAYGFVYAANAVQPDSERQYEASCVIADTLYCVARQLDLDPIELKEQALSYGSALAAARANPISATL